MSLATFSAFLWGLAEGLFFFIAPDVLLCYWALRGWPTALKSTIAVVIGAMTSACIMYVILIFGGKDAYTFMQTLWVDMPGFHYKMAETAAHQVAQNGAQAFLYGPTSGIPYRVYLLEAWRGRVTLSDVLFWTPFARLEQVLLGPIVVLVVHGTLHWYFVRQTRAIKPENLQRLLAILISVYWVFFYAWYWGALVPKLYG